MIGVPLSPPLFVQVGTSTRKVSDQLRPTSFFPLPSSVPSTPPPPPISPPQKNQKPDFEIPNSFLFSSSSFPSLLPLPFPHLIAVDHPALLFLTAFASLIFPTCGWTPLSQYTLLPFSPAQGMIRHPNELLSSTRLQNRCELTQGTIPPSLSLFL